MRLLLTNRSAQLHKEREKKKKKRSKESSSSSKSGRKEGSRRKSSKKVKREKNGDAKVAKREKLASNASGYSSTLADPTYIQYVLDCRSNYSVAHIDAVLNKRFNAEKVCVEYLVQLKHALAAWVPSHLLGRSVMPFVQLFEMQCIYNVQLSKSQCMPIHPAVRVVNTLPPLSPPPLPRDVRPTQESNRPSPSSSPSTAGSDHRVPFCPNTYHCSNSFCTVHGQTPLSQDEPLSNLLSPHEPQVTVLDSPPNRTSSRSSDSVLPIDSANGGDTPRLRAPEVEGTQGSQSSTSSKQTHTSTTTKDPLKREPKSIVHDLFGGKLLSRVTCVKCGHSGRKVESFLDLSVNVPDPDQKILLSRIGPDLYLPKDVGVEDCLRGFCAPEKLHSHGHMYRCSSCQQITETTKSITLRKLPEVLCIHFKRFKWTDGVKSKLTTTVRFPLTGLDMSRYMNHPEGEGSSGDEPNTEYDLVAVVMHHGSGMRSGHYTSFALNSVSQQWYHFDDNHVTHAHAWDVQDSEPYILFYQRRSSTTPFSQ